MTKRVINKSLIRSLVKEMGSVERVAVEANCSGSLIWKLMSDDYDVIPSIQKIDGLCFAFKKSLDELFPVVEAGRESA